MSEQHEQHRWFKFNLDGRKQGIRLQVENGRVELSVETVELLLREAGYEQHDPDPVEQAWQRRREAARSRLQDALNRRAR